MKTWILILAIAGVVIAIVWLERARPARPRPNANSQAAAPGAPAPQLRRDSAAVSDKSTRYPLAPELVNPGRFINSDPFTLGALVGKKVVLVDFWTYSCINCQRTTPYLNAWYEKYRAGGLEIVGVHTPEFEFEKKYDNVLAAVRQFGIKYPVVQDNDYATWSAYRNRYWPHKYLMDIDGFIVYDHIGEGGYEETELKIQELLQEKMENDALAGALSPPIGLVQPEGADSPKAQSPETYFGASRNEFLGNGKPDSIGRQSLAAPQTPRPNRLYLAGDWNFTPEYAANVSVGASITYRYVAEDVFLVASGPAPGGVKIKIRRNGRPLTPAEAGTDVVWEQNESYVIVKEERLYKIIRESAGVGTHTLELIIESPGLKAYAFTFG